MVRLKLKILKMLIFCLVKIINIFNSNLKILIISNNAFFFENGISLNIKYSNRYLKSILKGNKGNSFEEFFNYNKSIISDNLESIIDVGSNYGEFTFFVSNKFPNSKILSIEGSSLNYGILKQNFQNSILKNKNIFLVNKIITENVELTKITTNKNAENQIISKKINSSNFDKIKNENFEISESDTLIGVCKKFNFDKIDFLKVDIEGAEIFLKNDILLLKPKYIMLEFDARKTNVQKYIDMMKSLEQLYLIFRVQNNFKLLSINNVENMINDSVNISKLSNRYDFFLKLK